jgi:hypothetical protein
MAKPSARVPVDSLVDLACRDGIDVRPTLVRVLTDLYVQRPDHSAEEETQYTELVLGLIDSVDPRTRAAVAEKLRLYPGAPRAILQKLDSLTAAKSSQNENSEDLLELFFSSASEDRRLILTNLDVVADSTKRRQVPTHGELARRLEAAALRREPAEFSRVLSRALDIDGSLAQRITRDDSGEPVVVAAKVLSIKAEVLQRILLFLNPAVGQSVQRIFELCRLYDEISPAAAERMLTIWQSNYARPRLMREPVYWNDERRNSRSSETSESTYHSAKQRAQPARPQSSSANRR